MVQIEPIKIWSNGKTLNAVFFELQSVFDNLKDTATFYYKLLSTDLITLADGNLTMIEPDYTLYSTSTDSNAFAYEWAAIQLNLTIINFYGERTSAENTEK